MNTWIFTLLILLVSAQQITQVELNTQLSGTLEARGKAYYSVTIPQVLQNNSVLIATVDVL